MRRYLEENDEGRLLLLPATPAIYVWGFDFQGLLGRDPEYVRDALARYLRHEGRPETMERLFSRVRLTAIRQAMRPDRLRRVVEIFSSETEFSREFARLLTDSERPLYVGISKNLRRRTEEHLSSGDRLHDSLGELQTTDCAVRWIDATEICPNSIDDVSDTLDFDEELDTSDLATLESLLIRSSSATVNKKKD